MPHLLFHEPLKSDGSFAESPHALLKVTIGALAEERVTQQPGTLAGY